jgi:FkbM family methyltransferase
LCRRLGFEVADPAMLEAIVASVVHGGRRYRFLADRHGNDVQQRHRRGEIYEPEALETIAPHMPRGGRFLDLGANVGNHALVAALGMGAGHVIAVEPNPAAAAILRVNVLLNDADRLVTLHEVIASAEEGEALFSSAPGSALSLGRVLGADEAEPSAAMLRTVPADALVGGLRVDFVKIDVEGHEMAALAGLARTVDRDRPMMYVEVDDANAEDFRGWVARADYRVLARRRTYPVNENFLIGPAARA